MRLIPEPIMPTNLKTAHTVNLRYLLKLAAFVLLLSVLMLASRQVAADPISEFVSVDSLRFEVNGMPYHFAGTNCYYLMTWAADPSLRTDVDEVLGEAALMGFEVIRTWGFNDGGGLNALQTAPGVYDETVFRGLDYVLDRCRTLGLRVVLPLVNNWVDYGGMDQYVTWSTTAQFHDDFYADDSTRVWYRNHAEALVNRVNFYNGMTYRDDPTIFAWELANEPRCPSDVTGNTLVAWIEEMSAYIRAIDPNHLITTGIEGFFDDDSGPWYLNGSQGVDFQRDHQIPTIDYATAHSWPDHWGLDLGTTMNLLSRQLCEARDAIGKPMVLEEYGKVRDGALAMARNHYNPATYFSPGNDIRDVPGAAPVGTVQISPSSAFPVLAAATTERDLYFQTYCDSLVVHQAGGASVWISYHDSYPDYDGFGIYIPQDSSTVAILELHATAMSQLGDPTVSVWDPIASELTSRLGLPYPNPFSNRVSLELIGIAPGVALSAAIFDIRGRQVRVIFDGLPRLNRYTFVWDGLNSQGQSVSAGVYFLRFDQAGNVGTRRVVHIH